MAGKALINIKFAADLKQFSTQMQNASRSISKMGKKLQNVGATLSVGVTAPLTAFAAVSLKNWDKQVKAIAQVEAGLKSTGSAVGYTSKELQNMASNLQNNTLFGDEDILKNVTSQLLTFTNIAGEQFGRTQQAALDLATRLDGDLKSASIQLGKALNDPVANLSALSRSGIQFSEDQKATINSLVETNRLAEAQTIILDELQKQYGGSAKAAAEAGTGWLKQISNAIGDVTEDFGKHINTALKPFSEKIKEVVQQMQNWSPETKKLILVIGGLAAAIGPVLVVLGLLMTSVVPGLITSFGYLRASVLLLQTGFLKLTAVIAANPFGALAVAIAAVASYFVFFNNKVDDAIEKQSLLSEINNKAAKSIANEKAKLQELLFIARNENIEKSARLKAIKELNKLSPKYLGDLDLEKINTDKAREAIELYNAELLKTAKIKAAQNKLQELQSKIIDLELAKGNQSINIAKEKSSLQNDVNLSVAQKAKLLEVTNKNQQLGNILTGKELESLKQQENQLLKIIGANQTLNKVVATNPSIPQKTTERPKVSGIDTSGLLQGLDFAAPLQEQATIIDTTLTGMQEKFSAFKNASLEIGNAVGNAFWNMSNRLVDSFGLADSGFQGFVKGLAQTVTDLIAMYLSQSIASSIAGATASGTATGPAAIFTTPAFISTAIGGVLAAFAAIPKFETGGVVGGSSFTGDKILARVNSGELILNKRQQGNLLGMLNPAATTVNVQLSGGVKMSMRQLYFELQKEEKYLSRTSG